MPIVLCICRNYSWWQFGIHVL